MLRSETAARPDRMAKALEGLRLYQQAHRPPVRALAPAVASLLGASLRDYGGSGPPVLFVPSLINPPNVLDLGDRSLLRWLAGQGHRPFLLDWGTDLGARHGLDISGHVEHILLPLIGACADHAGETPALVGYCLGGTMALAAAALTPQVPRLATIAAPWSFSGYPAEARAQLARLWTDAKPVVDALGLMPIELLQSAFWTLDPARTVAKFEAFAAMDRQSPQAAAFVLLEDWANDGPPLTAAAAEELFQDLFGSDLPGTGAWTLASRTIDPARLPCPFLNIVSTTDRIAPAATAAPAGRRLDIAQGHVGMVVGGMSRKRLWEPLAEWLAEPREF